MTFLLFFLGLNQNKPEGLNFKNNLQKFQTKISQNHNLLKKTLADYHIYCYCDGQCSQCPQGADTITDLSAVTESDSVVITNYKNFDIDYSKITPTKINIYVLCFGEEPEVTFHSPAKIQLSNHVYDDIATSFQELKDGKQIVATDNSDETNCKLVSFASLSIKAKAEISATTFTLAITGTLNGDSFTIPISLDIDIQSQLGCTLTFHGYDQNGNEIEDSTFQSYKFDSKILYTGKIMNADLYVNLLYEKYHLYCFCDGVCPDICSGIDRINFFNSAEKPTSVILTNYKTSNLDIKFDELTKVKDLILLCLESGAKFSISSFDKFTMSNEVSESEILSKVPSLKTAKLLYVTDSSNTKSVSIYGHSLQPSAIIKDTSFTLKIDSVVSDNTFTVPIPLILNFEKDATITLTISQNKVEIPIDTYKNYIFSPKLQYTGTITNADTYSNVLAPKTNLYCYCENQCPEKYCADLDTTGDPFSLNVANAVIYTNKKEIQVYTTNIVQPPIIICLEENTKIIFEPLDKLELSTGYSGPLDISSEFKDSSLIYAEKDQHSLKFIGKSMKPQYVVESHHAPDNLGLTITGKVNANKFTVPCSLEFALENALYIDVKLKTQDNQEITSEHANDYEYEPQIQYKGVIHNIDSYSNLFYTKKGVYCICRGVCPQNLCPAGSKTLTSLGDIEETLADIYTNEKYLDGSLGKSFRFTVYCFREKETYISIDSSGMVTYYNDITGMKSFQPPKELQNGQAILAYNDASITKSRSIITIIGKKFSSKLSNFNALSITMVGNVEGETFTNSIPIQLFVYNGESTLTINAIDIKTQKEIVLANYQLNQKIYYDLNEGQGSIKNLNEYSKFLQEGDSGFNDYDLEIYCLCNGECPGTYCSNTRLKPTKVNSITEVTDGKSMVFTNYDHLKFDFDKVYGTLHIVSYANPMSVTFDSPRIIGMSPKIESLPTDEGELKGFKSCIASSTRHMDDPNAKMIQVSAASISAKGIIKDDSLALDISDDTKDKNFNLACSLQLNLEKETTLEIFLNRLIDIDSKEYKAEEIPVEEMKNYVFAPKIKFTGKITNFDTYKDLLEETSTPFDPDEDDKPSPGGETPSPGGETPSPGAVTPSSGDGQSGSQNQASSKSKGLSGGAIAGIVIAVIVVVAGVVVGVIIFLKKKKEKDASETVATTL